MRHVVITGMGIIGPIGTGVADFWRAVIEGKSGIGRITRFDATSYACQIAGEVRDCSYEEVLDPRKLRTTTHATQLALAATEFALRDARLPRTFYEPALVGVSLGTSLGGWRDSERQYGVLLERGAGRVNPFIANGSPPYTPGVEVASALGAQGVQMTVSTGCTSSLEAIAHGARLIARDGMEMCVVGGTESPLSPLVVAGMIRTRELCTSNDDPEHACRPFDRRHAGLVLSEGSCILVLESAERATRRGATVYAEILGSGSSCDACGVYATDSSGQIGARAIHTALKNSGLGPADVDYVCSHANSSPTFDRKETRVIKAAFAEFAGRLPVSSIKAVLGHPFGASGAFQVAAAALAIRHQTIPPTHNLEEADPECDLDYVPGEARAAAIRAALVSSYGYGGLNAYLVLAGPSTAGLAAT